MTDLVPSEEWRYKHPKSLLEHLSRAAAGLAEIQLIEDALKIADLAESVRYAAKQAQVGMEVQNHAAEIRLRAERRAGELLTQADKNTGGQAEHESYRSYDATGRTPTLSDLGLNKSQSSRYQQVAAVSGDVFEGYIATAQANEEEITTNRLLRESARTTRAPRTPSLPRGEFGCITIDPPWPVEKIEREVRPAQTSPLDYPTMSLGEIDELVGPLVRAQDGCHVYLWATHKFIPAAFSLFESWNVRYECLLTWVKNVGIAPYSWMYDTEHILFGRRGSLPLQKQGLRLSFQASAQGHSIKPDVFYERVCQASPEPRLAMFERANRPGFDVWGNEI